MAHTPNIADILDLPAIDSERPKPFPQGTYIAQLQGLPREDLSPRKQTRFLEFTLLPVDVYRDKHGRSDVDEVALEAMGGFGNRTLRDTYYLTEDAMYRVRDFLTNCGIPLVEGKRKLSHNERIAMSPGAQVGISVKHNTGADGSSIFANVASTFKVE